MCSNFWLENSKFWFAIGRHSLSLNASFTCFCVMCDIQPWTNTAKTGVFINNPRYDPICFTIVANCFTGHSKLWSVAHCFIVLLFSLLFWDLNVRETLSARRSLELLWGMMLPLGCQLLSNRNLSFEGWSTVTLFLYCVYCGYCYFLKEPHDYFVAFFSGLSQEVRKIKTSLSLLSVWCPVSVSGVGAGVYGK